MTAIFIPKYVLPQMTYTNPKHVMVMATGADDLEFTCGPHKIKPFGRAIERVELVFARGPS